jgi:rhodanese-related sulfurtransferase
MNCLFDRAVVFIRKSGFRGYMADMAALVHGYKDVYNLHNGTDGGGIHDAELQIDRVISRYR